MRFVWSNKLCLVLFSLIYSCIFNYVFFFRQKTAYEMSISDWSSDVCSSDLNPDLPQGHLGPVWDTINRGRTYVIEVTNMRADGTRFPVEVHSAGFQHDGRKCLVAVARDLSGRHDAELRYRELMEVIDKGVVVQDEHLNFTYGNSAALRLLGIDGDESLDDAMRLENWMLVREDGTVMPEAEYPSVRAMREGRIIESTLLGLYHRQRRQLSWLSVTVVPQYAADADRPHQVLSMFSDVTALKRDRALFTRVQAPAPIGGRGWDFTSRGPSPTERKS